MQRKSYLTDDCRVSVHSLVLTGIRCCCVGVPHVDGVNDEHGAHAEVLAPPPKSAKTLLKLHLLYFE